MAKEPLKIAYFIDRLIRGGTELQLVEQINQLEKRGVHQELFCLYKSTEHDKINVKCKIHILNIEKLLSIHCIKSIYRLADYLKKNSFSIVQTYFFDSTIVGVLAAKLARRAKIISCRRDLGFWYTTKLLLVLRIINKMTDNILVNSDAVKMVVAEMEKVKERKINVMHNGIYLKEFDYDQQERSQNRIELGIKPNQICVGIIANMSRRVKRLDVFLYAAAYVITQKKKYHFIIMGDGKYKKELINMAQYLGISDNILFLGRDVSKHKVLSVLDIGILTSDSEGFSNAIMEYMAAGLPVIATAVGGNLELVDNQKNGLLAKAGDYISIGKKIISIGDNYQKSIEFGINGRRLIEKHDWANISFNMIAYYNEIIDSLKVTIQRKN